MRRFVLIAHDIPLDGGFSLDDLPGTGGRVDVLCRCITAAFLLSHDIRRDVQVKIVVRDAATITMTGRNLRRLNPDERSTAARIRTALAEYENTIGRQPIETSPGVTIERADLEMTLESIGDDGTFYQLDPEGSPIVADGVPDDPIFLLSDHRPFSTDDQRTIDRFSPRKRTLSPRSLHADHAIAIAQNWLDTAGFTEYQPER